MPLRKPPELRRSPKTPLQVEFAPSELFTAVIGPTAQNLGEAVLSSMRCVEDTIILAFGRKEGASPRIPLHSSDKPDCSTIEGQLGAIRNAQKQLAMANEDSRDKFGVLYGDIDTDQVPDGSAVEVPKEIYDGSLSMIALLQMAGEMATALHIAERLIVLCLESPSRLWYPRISLAWLGVPPGPFVSDDPAAKLSVNLSVDQNVMCSTDVHLLSENERRQGLAEYTKGVSQGTKKMTSVDERHAGKTQWTISCLWNTLLSSLRWLWTNPRSMDLRVNLWFTHRAIVHSHHLQHALKAAVGVAILTFPAFMSNTSSGYKWYQRWHGQWMTVRYAFIISD